MSQQNKTTLQSCINTQLADNSTGDISAADIRNNLINITDSLLFNSGSQSITGSLVVTDLISINTLRIGTGGGNVSSNISIGCTTNFSSSATGTNNFAAGIQALQNNTTGTSNTAIGNAALRCNTTGIYNTAIGDRALCSNKIGDSNTAIGNLALFANTTGCYNTAIGNSALCNNTIGEANTAIGRFALNANTSGSHNIAIGLNALKYNTTGCHNTAIGRYALCYNYQGSNNTAIGNCALRFNTTGSHNTAIGNLALYNNSTGTHNTAIGSNTLYCNNGGSNNIALGQSSGLNFTGNSSNNIAIGFAAGPSTSTQENDKLYIASGSGTPLIKGDFAAKTVNISGSLTATSFTGSLQGTASFASNIAPGGATTEIQYNNAGVLAGTSTLTFNGTTITANPISATGYFIPANALGGLSTVGADYTISDPGVYRFTSMDSSGTRFINFPNPASKSYGQTIIIINSDTTYTGYYGTTYPPEDPSGTAITTIAASTADTFVNIDSKWIRISKRP